MSDNSIGDSMNERPVEVSWFSALCDDDYQFLGIEDPALKASWPHCRDIALTAEQNGFDNILLPSGYQLGMDSIGFAGGIAPLLEKMRLLVAVRCGEMWVPQLARQLATLDQMLGGRLTINIISSDLPGQQMDGAPRYQRTLETMQALRQFLNGEAVQLDGAHIQLDLAPPRMQTVSGKCPPFYFGGLSPAARDVAAREADVFLMWPDTMDKVADILTDMRARASAYKRQLKFGYRVHVIVRETEAQARDAADQLVSRLDDKTGEEIRNRSLDSASYGVRRQAEMRDAANAAGTGDYVEDNLWTGIGRARSGCGAAIVGDPDQVLAKLNAYRALGIEAFILSGYPHRDECDLFGRYVLPRLNHGALQL
jgi:alkanesulfonate monooxygenase